MYHAMHIKKFVLQFVPLSSNFINTYHAHVQEFQLTQGWFPYQQGNYGDDPPPSHVDQNFLACCWTSPSGFRNCCVPCDHLDLTSRKGQGQVAQRRTSPQGGGYIQHCCCDAWSRDWCGDHFVVAGSNSSGGGTGLAPRCTCNHSTETPMYESLSLLNSKITNLLKT